MRVRSRCTQRCLAAVLSVALLSVGCTKVRTANVARLDLPVAQRTESVRYTGTYIAKWTPTNRKKLRPIPGSERYAVAGDHLGFQQGDEGRLIGLHGDTPVLQTDLPAGTRYVIWQSQQVVKTQFARELEDIGHGAGQAAVVVGVVAIVGFLIYDDPGRFVDALLNSDDEQ